MKKTLLVGLILISSPIALFAREYSTYSDCSQDNGTKFCDGYFAGKEKINETQKTETTVSTVATPQTSAPEQVKLNTTKKNDNYLFFGGNLGFSAVSYKEEAAAKIMPTGFLKGGFEFGFKFDVADDYGMGLTGAMDFLFPSEVNPSYSHALGVDSITVGYDMYGFYFDNYLKTGKDESIVLGFGIADMYQTMTAKLNGQTEEMSSDDGNSVFLIKMGMIYNLSEMTDFTIMGKLGFPDEKTGLSMITMIDLGLRFRF